ncbi:MULTISPECIES: hypothetical protein [unclassified Dysgonomonas]|jgi:hypothetical protein|uniref:hypothetical protein n=1 Tax=unclassified Dysgonomonas TaxID=2630389 RepID=UPI0025C1BF25|nr:MULTISPECIES: hypothetical protein [unclassified Dysgonomonas]MDR2005461.1 hypothetical protein [Prevotella sp.]HMM02488.1 hypothetical protein [Dysgonomonas sp.]
MENKLIDILNKIEFSKKYIDICNRYSDFDNGKNFQKKDILEILLMNKIDMEFSSKEKLFYKDYFISNYIIRFLFSFKYGFIECFYTIRYNDDSENISGRFNSIATLQNADFNNMVKHKFPIATSIEDLQNILNELLRIHNDFIVRLKENGF